MSAPVFTGVHFWVSDVAASLKFYRAIGLDVPDETWEGKFVNIRLPGGMGFALAAHELTEGYDPGFRRPSGQSTNCLEFDLESREAVDEMYQRLTGMGYRGHLAPIDAFWGARYTEVCDPDGNVAGFHSPRDPARRAPPPGS